IDRERAPTAENLDQLVGGDQDHLPLGGRSDDPLSHQRAAVALDEIQLAVDLVGPVDRERDVRLEADEVDAELAGEARRLLGRGHAMDLEPSAHARREGVDERAGGAAGAEADDIAVPDEAEGMRRKRRERIVGRRRHGRGTRPSQRIPLRQTARERDYWLRIPISCSKKPRSGGRFVNRAWNASRSTASRLTLERLRTVAVRALSPTSAISPKHSPGPSEPILPRALNAKGLRTVPRIVAAMFAARHFASRIACWAVGGHGSPVFASRIQAQSPTAQTPG